ncbi:MAG: hypothetical protein EZS28_051536, partial [Streblomastix strix]
SQDATNPTEKSLIQFRSNIVTHQYIFQSLYPKLANRQLNSNSSNKRRGAVLFTASGLAIITTPGSVVYSATKAYLGHLGECLATEAESFGIDVVSLYPGMVNSLFSKRGVNELPPFVEKINQNPNSVASLALSGIGRVTRVDSGFQAVTMRLITKVIDANIFIKILSKVGSKKKNESKKD